MPGLIRATFLITLLPLVLGACVVSKKQFDELLTEKVKLEGEMTDLEGKMAKLEVDIKELEENLKTTTTERDGLEKELLEKKNTLSDLQAEHDQLQGYYENAVNNSGRMSRDLTEQANKLMALQKTLEQAEYENNLLADTLEQREQKVAELERVLSETQTAINDLKNLVSDALVNFGAQDLTVEQRDGRIYVSLSEQLLFKSGSAVVDPKGQQALAQLAEALQDSKDVRILVEGHTDNVPVSRTSQYMKNNWDLSVMRATSIVDILLKNGVDANQITAAGRGEHDPKAANDSKENRQKNRRTEIILTPDLSALIEALGQN
jgi:chemotaxis protein MotB